MIIRSYEYNVDLPGVMSFHFVRHLPRLVDWERRKSVPDRHQVNLSCTFIACPIFQYGVY